MHDEMSYGFMDTTKFPWIRGRAAAIGYGHKVPITSTMPYAPAPNVYTIPSIFSKNKIVSTGRELSFHGAGPRAMSLTKLPPHRMGPGPGSYEPYQEFGINGKYISIRGKRKVDSLNKE